MEVLSEETPTKPVNGKRRGEGDGRFKGVISGVGFVKKTKWSGRGGDFPTNRLKRGEIIRKKKPKEKFRFFFIICYFDSSHIKSKKGKKKLREKLEIFILTQANYNKLR